jgi:hypothetical protein
MSQDGRIEVNSTFQVLYRLESKEPGHSSQRGVTEDALELKVGQRLGETQRLWLSEEGEKERSRGEEWQE